MWPHAMLTGVLAGRVRLGSVLGGADQNEVRQRDGERWPVLRIHCDIPNFLGREKKRKEAAGTQS